MKLITLYELYVITYTIIIFRYISVIHNKFKTMYTQFTCKWPIFVK